MPGCYAEVGNPLNEAMLGNSILEYTRHKSADTVGPSPHQAFSSCSEPRIFSCPQLLLLLASLLLTLCVQACNSLAFLAVHDNDGSNGLVVSSFLSESDPRLHLQAPHALT